LTTVLDERIFIRKIIIILTPLIWLFGCRVEEQKPRLVVFLSFDHLAFHAYTHYQPLFTGGIKWLHDHGVMFNNAHHEHGYTATGPGHFVLGSGLYPGPAGLLGNSWYDRKIDGDVYCVEDQNAQPLGIPSNNVSYGRVNGTTVGDWLKAVSPESKVYSVAGKDRAAILMGGKTPDLVLWYNWQGAFTTTDYYTSEIPAWLYEFNKEQNFQSYRDSVWTRSLKESIYDEYAHPDSFFGESDRYLNKPYSPVFPIGFEAEWDDAKIYEELGGRPWMDRMTLDLALRVIDVAEVGKDLTPDILNIGLSAMDIIAHYYGPYSHETMDHLIKVDQYLKIFLDRLDERVGLQNVVFALSTDHGGLPLPEHLTQIQKKRGGRIDENTYLATRAKAYAVLDSVYGNHDFIHRKGSSYYYKHPMLDSMDVNFTLIDSILQTYMESVEGVYRLYPKSKLVNPDPSDPYATRLSRFMHPEQSPDLYTLKEEGWLFRNPFGTSHGTPYEYDSHIPLIFSHQNFSSQFVDDSVSTVDIAPTLGDILGIRPLNEIDGVSLRPYLTKD